MAQHIEIEFKNLLTKREFDELIDVFDFTEDDFIKQTNYYFDSSLFTLKNKQIALRIREKNNTYELTLKQPAKIGILETNEMISAHVCEQMLQTGEIPPGHVKKIIDTLLPHRETLIHFGTLTTSRAEKEYEDGLLVLDHSSYLNQSDYEVEYEVSDEKLGQQRFAALLAERMIPKRHTENKMVRFYNELKQQK